MNEVEVRKLLKIIGEYDYPDFKVESKEDVDKKTNAWLFALEDYDYGLISQALKQYLQSANAFAPKPGMLIELSHSVEDLGDPTEIEVTTLIMKAVSNSSYNSVSEYNKLPELAQRVVGSASQLRMWAIDEHFNRGVVESAVQRTYRTVDKRAKDYRRMTPEMKALADTFFANRPQIDSKPVEVPLIETDSESEVPSNEQIDGYTERLKKLLWANV